MYAVKSVSHYDSLKIWNYHLACFFVWSWQNIKGVSIHICHISLPLRGYCIPNQKLAYFALYLKIINTAPQWQKGITDILIFLR